MLVVASSFAALAAYELKKALNEVVSKRFY